MNDDSSSSIDMISYAPADGRWKPEAPAPAPALPNCPRCNSSNTKFCYYNNYSLSQPRYLCKGCRRYWTKGGSLRNVPVGGGCRKTRRGKSLRLSAPPSAPRIAPRENAAAIDLEVLYAKYLNPAAPSTTSSESSCGGQIPLQFPTEQQLPSNHPPLMGETLAMSQINEYMLCDFSANSDSSLALLPPPPAIEQLSCYFDCPKDSSSTNFDEFESFPILTSTCTQQTQGLVVEEDEWSSLDYSTMEAFYRC